MPRFPTLYLLLLIAAVLGCTQVLAEVTVRFEPTGEYTDLAIGGSSTPAIQNELLKQLEEHFKQLGGRYLLQGDKLEIVVLDIDMAGAKESWRTPNLNDARIIRDTYPPIITLHYIWHDNAGNLKADKQEKVSELNFLILRGSGYYTNNDPLRYEKALLDRWFRRTFSVDVEPVK